MGVLRLSAAAVVLMALFPPAGLSQTLLSTEPEEISINADQLSYDQKANTVIARGQVVIIRGETELHADEVRLNRATSEVEASGDVSISSPEGTVHADSVHLNLDEETGVMDDAEIRAPRLQYSLWGDRVEKGLGQSYHIENGRFTTCNCAEGPPSWSISGRDLRVVLDGYGTLRGGTFNVLGVPILYVPRALFPVQRERQSGFLMPRFGASNRRGFQTLVPFYWAINKSQDATLAFDVETSARAGLVGEYRYALTRDVRGVLSASYFNESFRGAAPNKPFEVTVPENRWSIVTEHTQPFIGDSQAYVDAFLVSDDLFLRDINTYAFEHSRDVAVRTLPFTESRAGAVQLWDRFALKGEGTYYQNLTGLESQTLQRAPEVDLWGQGRLGGGLLGDLTVAGVDFQRAQGADGFRLDIQPGATLPVPLGRFAFGALRATLRETAYHLTDQTLSDNGRTVPEDQSRELLQVGADVGTTFDRVYPFHWLGLEKLKHTLEPGLSYLYVPAVSQADLPLLDGTDRVNHRNLITYGLVSRFVGKLADSTPDDSEEGRDPGSPQRGSSVRELARFSLAQSFDISRRIGALQTGSSADHFSDIDLSGRVNPSRALSIRFLTNYDAGNNNISAATVGFFVEDPRYQPSAQSGPRLDTTTSAGVSYRFLTGNLLQEVDDNLVLRLTDSIGFLYSSRYDIVANRFLDNFFGLRLISTCDCWALDFAVTDRTNPQEVEVRAQLTLAGLGSSKSQRRVAAAP